jgi:hypothetical protein
MSILWSGCCGAKVIHYDICSNCHKECMPFVDELDESDAAYDAAKDTWVLGDEPMNSNQKRENDSWEKTCRREER